MLWGLVASWVPCCFQGKQALPWERCPPHSHLCPLRALPSGQVPGLLPGR